MEEANQNLDSLLPGPEPEYLVLEWLADSRYVRPRTSQYYSSILVLAVLFSVFLFLANQGVLIFLVWAFFFITIVLARVKPETVQIQLTTYGIRYQDQLIFWEEISRFWVKEIGGFFQIHVEVPEKMFKQLILLPSSAASPVVVTVEQVIDILGRVIPYEEPIPNRFDNWVQWLEEKFPLESESLPPVVPSASPVMPVVPAQSEQEPAVQGVPDLAQTSQPVANADQVFPQQQ